MPPQLRAALYNRVSTSAQHPEAPLDSMRDYARRARAKVVMVRTEIHSGKTDGPGLSDVLRAARASQIDMLIIPRIDRMGRSVVNVARNVAQLESDGCRLDSIHEALIIKPGGDPMSRFAVHLFASIAEMVRASIIERTYEGLQAARARGSRLGRRPTTLAALPDAGAVNQLRAAGMHRRDVAAQLGCSQYAVRLVEARCLNCGRPTKWQPCKHCDLPSCMLCGHHRAAPTPLADECA